MARTAPVPNIPPIPGMCPSVAVMGGGGGAGGGSGGGPGSGDGGASAAGEGGGDEAAGDGTGADACGSGTGGGCPNHNPSTAAGDPVDVATGRMFTLPVTDLWLGGPLPLEFARCYVSTAAKRNVGFGHGWLHTYAWEIESRAQSTRVYRSNGTHFSFPVLEAGAQALGRQGMLVQRTTDGYYVDADDGLYRDFETCVTDRHRARLARIRDAHGNAHTLQYDTSDRLVGMVDSVGRTVRFVRNAAGAVERLEVLDKSGGPVVFARYLHDAEGDLCAVEDADGFRSRFAYQSHLMTEHERPTGLTFHYAYNRKGECVETWGDYPGGTDITRGPKTSTVLADGSPAKGIHHVKITYDDDGYREVVSVRSSNRYFANEHGLMDKQVVGGGVTSRTFDQHGHELSKIDALGAEWRTERDRRGRVLSMTDPLGRTTRYLRDEAGRPVKIFHPNGGVTTLDRDSRGSVVRRADALGGVESFRHDERGNLIEHVNGDGEKRSYRWDALGNLIEAHYPNGGVYRYEFNFFGRRTATNNPRGHRFVTEWSLRGDALRLVDPNGGVTSYDYDGDRNMVRMVRADGSVYRYHWGAIGKLCRIEKPDGTVTSCSYELDGYPLQAINELGETYEYEFDARGFKVGERRWDGQEARYQYDAVGQTVSIRTSSGQFTEFEFDLAGQVLVKRFTDESEHRFAYDAMGRQIVAKTAETTVEFERDLLGGIINERQSLLDDTVEVKSFYRPGGARNRMQTSLGHVVEYDHDAVGHAKEIRSGALCIEFDHDYVGFERERRLPGGARIESEFDALGRLIRRSVPKASAARTRPGEPEWVGASSAGGLTRRYNMSSVGALLSVADESSTIIRNYEYDNRERLIALTDKRGVRTELAYDGAGHARPSDGARYGTGGVLQAWSTTEYENTAEGSIARKFDPADKDASTTTYHWCADGTLTGVETPDGRIVRFQYDAYGRRVLKTVLRRHAGAIEEVSRVRFIWDVNQLIQEITYRDGEVVSGRDYLMSTDSLAPIAHADYAGDHQRSWVYYVNDPSGVADELIDAAGTSVRSLTATPWGRQPTTAVAAHSGVTTPLRKQGEYFDEETGLLYNRYRYKDAETGRFLSTDPIGLRGGFNLYVPLPNAVMFNDPFGLSVESDRAAQIRENKQGSGWGTTTAVARLENGDTVIADSQGSLHPATRIREPGYENSRGTDGAAPTGGVTEDEFIQHAPPQSGSDIPNCHHAERRLIQHAEDNDTRITSISATANCCPTCRQALRVHNPAVDIVDPNGHPAPNP